MAIEHKDIPEAGLHEPKGASTATAKTVYSSDGAGSGVWEAPELAGQGAAALDEMVFSDGAGGLDWRKGKVGGSLILTGVDYTNQYPPTTDTALQVTYGGLQSTTEFDLSAAGALTCNTAGWYKFLWNLRFGRTAGTGTAQLLWRVLVNGVQIGSTAAVSVTNSDDMIPFTITASLPLAVADVVTSEVVRDSSGNDDGGLRTTTPTLGTWEKSASAVIRVDKEVVE